MASVFDYIFNVGGNFSASINGMTDATGRFEASINGARKATDGLWAKMMGFDSLVNVFNNVASGLQAISSSGIELDSQLHDVSAVAGVTGEGLKQIERYARESAKAFGTDASTAVTGYKLLLSQLSPELGKYPAALKAMGDSIQTTSKLMGGDGVAAAEVLTTAMNQYGVSLADPMKASEEMARMMNVMAAAGQAGSAELPAIKVALEQCGMAAKAAGVSFEETNAAIQVLDKAGKKGSEGGVALRNVMSTLAKGRFLPKDVKEELSAAGVKIKDLTDTTQPLKVRLESLKPIMNDSALLTKLFGQANANAARALVQGTESLGDFTEAVTGTRSAEEQAAIVMDSYAERQARVNQQIEDFKISLFQATGDLVLWTSSLTNIMVPVAQLLPLFKFLGSGLTGVWKAMVWIKNLQFSRIMYSCWWQVSLLKQQLLAAVTASKAFVVNMWKSTVAVVKFGATALWNAIKGMGSLLLSFVTTGAASVTFAGIAGTSFAAFSTAASTACRVVSGAIMSIPIVGWIAAAIAALVAVGVYFWNTSAKFRAVLKGLWASFKAVFKGIGEAAKNTFGAIGDLIKAAFSLDAKGISAAVNKLKKGFSDFGSDIGKAFNTAYEAEMTASAKKQAEGQGQPNKQGKKNGTTPAMPEVPAIEPPNPTAGTLGSVGKSAGSSGGSGSVRNITINVNRLVEKMEVHTATINESAERVKDILTEALLGALNDVNLAT